MRLSGWRSAAALRFCSSASSPAAKGVSVRDGATALTLILGASSAAREHVRASMAPLSWLLTYETAFRFVSSDRTEQDNRNPSFRFAHQFEARLNGRSGTQQIYGVIFGKNVCCQSGKRYQIAASPRQYLSAVMQHASNDTPGLRQH